MSFGKFYPNLFTLWREMARTGDGCGAVLIVHPISTFQPNQVTSETFDDKRR